MARFAVLLLLLLVLGSATPARGQSVLDRFVGPTPWNEPLTLHQLNAQTIGSLALAARVPIGLECAEAPMQRKWSIVGTGKTVREVLDALTALEPSYTWEETAGVIVIHPIASLSASRDVLNMRIPSFHLEDVQSAGALKALATLLGVEDAVQGPGDTKRFSVDVPDNSSIRDVLNAIVRAHGTLAWAYEYKVPTDAAALFPTSVFLFIGAQGTGIGIPRESTIGRVPGVAADAGAVLPDTASILDRVVGPDRRGLPLSMSFINPSFIADLARASQTPMGIQTTALDGDTLQSIAPTTVTGMRLRDALAVMAAADPRYEWREMNGVVVFRPVRAWLDGSDPLFRPVHDVQLSRTTLSIVMGVIASALGSPEHARNTIADSRRLTVDMPAGSVLDLLNATARAHGQLSWQFEEMSARDQRFFAGRRHMLTINIFDGGGQGMAVP